MAKIRNLWISVLMIVFILIFIGVTSNRFQGLVEPTGQAIGEPSSLFGALLVVSLVSAIILLSSYFYFKKSLLDSRE